MRKTLLALTTAAALSWAANASAAVVINFNDPSGLLGTSQVYGDVGTQVTAYGYTGGDPSALYGKAEGGDEDGVGLNSDPSGQHEIWFDAGGGTFIALDVSDLFGDASSVSVLFGSTTNGEEWEIFGSNVLGDLGSSLTSGTTEGNWILLPSFGTYTYYNFVSNNDGSDRGNVLLGALSFESAVPEPGTWAMMLLGFGAVGFSIRRRRQPTLAQAA